jgi:branched-subunit amino acid transport protein
MNAWAVILAAGLGSYLLRISMISSDRLRLPARFESSVELVAPAAFAALAATGLIGLALDAGDLLGVLPILAALAAATAVVARTNRPYLAVVAGMPAYWLATALTTL